MIKKIVFSDEITLFWDKDLTQSSSCSFDIYFNNKFCLNTVKTHFSFIGLQAEQEYAIKVVQVFKSEAGQITIFDSIVKTGKIKRKIDITKHPYNAIGDGKTLNTQAIQKALNDCTNNDYIYIPQGVFLTGALIVHSNTEIYIDPFGTIQGTTEVEDYLPKIDSRFEGIEMKCYSSLLNLGRIDKNGGYNCENVIIRGGGTICGGGKKLKENIINLERILLRKELEELGASIKEYESIDTIPARTRPRLINISNSRDVVLADIKIMHGPSWNVHMVYSDNITTYRCGFYSKGVWNGDGWDPDSTINSSIFNCDFFTHDDCVAIKSGKNPEGNLINRPTENIWIFDCRVHAGNGIAIGSEMSGGVKNIKIWDCNLKNSYFGLQIKTTQKRGGYVKNIFFNNCVAPRIMIGAVSYNDDGEPAPTYPQLSDFVFNKIELTGFPIRTTGEIEEAEPLDIEGLSSDLLIKNIRFNNVTINKKRITLREFSFVENVSFE